MNIRLLFEDKETTPSSILLKHSGYGKNIYFSGGCHRILNKICELKNIYKNDTIYVFYDVSPNNMFTRKYYNSLLQEIKSNPMVYNQVYIVPIVCIEYYICKMLNKGGYMCVRNKGIEQLVEAVVKKFDYAAVPKDILSIKKLEVSLEKIYKHILLNQHMKCLSNKFAYNKDTNQRVTSTYGIFYEKDCTCERKYCNINCNDCIQLKAERLYTELPIFIVDTVEYKDTLQKYGINIKNVTNSEIVDELQNMYDDMCSSMGVPLFKVII